MTTRTSMWWKVLLAVAVVAPMTAYVVGSLAASASQERAPRETIVIQDADRTPGPSRTPTPRSTPSASPSDDVEVIVPDYQDDDRRDDHGDDDGADHHGDDRDDRDDRGEDGERHGGGGDD